MGVEIREALPFDVANYHMVGDLLEIAPVSIGNNASLRLECIDARM
jgi:hypothetical protein